MSDQNEIRSVWLDQIPYEMPIAICVDCNRPIEPMRRYVHFVGTRAVIPLCEECYALRTSQEDDA